MLNIAESALADAQRRDREDELKGFRSRFYFPRRSPDAPAAASPAADRTRNSRPEDASLYFCGNSLGLQPHDTEAYFRQELTDWRELAVAGYWQAHNPWMTSPRTLCGPLSRLAGCSEDEVTVMNALTVNLHLLLLTFYRPGPHRYKILMEAGAFPSDQYAMETRVKWHGYDPREAIIEVGPRPGEWTIREEDVVAAIGEQGESLALVLLGGINYYTGQLFDMATITAAAHEAGALAGFDLAHAIGNAPLSLHDWDVDFAVWCSYKYLNGGPGAAAGAFIHERHVRDTSLARLGGWWGNDEAGRFRMEKGFVPKPTAEGWSMSTAQVFNMVALRASLALFEEAGFDRLQRKSRALTGYLDRLLQDMESNVFRVITPERRAAQLSLFFGDRAKEIQQRLMQEGVVTDFREPGVIRVSPAPLYNSFEDVYRLCLILRSLL
ncbi:MAG TPA: kynureninase [Puia sp.]|jgi:kynureninase|nr:kynureninase [Puia sp.]